MENTHAEKDSNMWPKADVSLNMGLEMTQCNSGWSSWPEKKKTKNQKRRYNSLESTDIDDNRPEGTFSINTTPVQVDSFPHPPINTCLSADREITQHDAEVILSQDRDKGMEQNKRHNALESNDINQDHKEGGNRPSHSLTNTEYVERRDDNYVSEKAEKLNCFPKCVDDSSIKKHDDHVHVNIISLDVSNIQTYQVNKQNIRRRKRRKFSDTMEGSLGFIEDGAGSSVLVVQDSSVRDTSLNHSDEAPASGYSEKMLGDVVAGYGSSLLVVGDISVGKASVECPGGEIASSEWEKKIKIENLKEIINEHSVVKGVSWADPPGKKLERGNSDKLNVFHNTVQDIYSSKRRFDKSTTFYKEGKASDDASGSDPSVEKLESDNLEIHPKVKDAISSSSQLGVWNDEVSLTVIRKDGPQQMLQPSLGAATGNSRKKLLVLDVNGLLADIVSYVSPGYKPDAFISKKAVFKRPFCDDFLQFCFERFHVGVWSSRTKRNVESVLDFLMGKSKCNLLFCWDQSQCTDTGFNTVENREKPLLLKELKRLWEKHEPDLPWDRGVYNESNTLLLDDSPYKALRNPLHTAIFPHPYRYKDVRDNSLGPSGDLRIYLVGLASADNVQKYVEQNPFGQRPITNKNLSWPFYLKVIGSTTSTQQEEDANNSSACHRNNFQT